MVTIIYLEDKYKIIKLSILGVDLLREYEVLVWINKVYVIEIIQWYWNIGMGKVMVMLYDFGWDIGRYLLH